MLSIAPHQQCSSSVAVNHPPTGLFQRRDQRIVVGEQRVSKAERIPVLAPAGADLGHAGVLSQKLGAVKIAPAVEEDLACTVRTVNQISAKLIERKQAGCGRES